MFFYYRLTKLYIKKSEYELSCWSYLSVYATVIHPKVLEIIIQIFDANHFPEPYPTELMKSGSPML